MTNIRRALLVFALACATMLVAFAQNETGQITGTITDPSGAGVPAATITARSAGTGVTRTTTASADGAYTIAQLLPGEYVVTVTAAGFNRAERRVNVNVGLRIAVDIRLDVASASTTVEVSEQATQVNTESQTIGQVVNEREIRDLPNLTRNPYQFVALAGNVSDAGMGTRGAGVSINGQREASTNILLDGASNNDEFSGSIGQQVPLDSVQEFSVLTSNFTAEYGRASGGVVNVVTKAGTNAFHGTAYEFNRVSALSSNSFQNNATGVDKSPFTRNQFGYSLGGPVKKDKLFFFSSTEWIRVRSIATGFAWVPTPDLIALTPSNVQSFFNAYGQVRPTSTNLGTISLNQLPSNPCAGAACASIPANLPIFQHVAYNTPTDAGGGFPQNTYMTVNRLDYNLSDRTQLYGRYALYSEVDTAGVLSNSPYANYDLGQNFFNHNGLLTMIHTFSPRWVSQSKVVFNRLTNLQPGTTAERGLVPTMYPNTTGTVAIGVDNIAFPGYNPFTPGNGGDFGGPQNLLQFYQDMSYVRGGHSFRFGGTYDYQRDNRTYAAYQTAANGLANASGLAPTLNALLAGTYATVQVAIDPKGKYPCAVSPADCNVTLPASQPNFSRSNRYHEFALYGQDSWKVTPRFTANLGLRWEYFGVQHNKNAALDSNWYAPGVGFPDDNLVAYLQKGSMVPAPDSPSGRVWNPSWHNFGPRVGFAWDVTGDGRTSVRAGYGIAYERNFGNVTFNLIQNPPNYAVLALPGPITNDNLGPFAGTGGSLPLGRVGARVVDPDIKTAYAHMWNVALERQLTRGIVWSAEYSGSKGVDLYTISYPNQAGFGNFAAGIPCNGLDDTNTTDCGAQVNPAWANSFGYRGNQGFSIYHGLNNRLRMLNVFNSGVDMIVNYTWSHAIDNLSSTFFEAGVSNLYGNTNITIANGNYVRGLLDPFHPALDRGDAEFDIRHRVTVAGAWRVPFKSQAKLRNAIVGGWSVNPLFTARTGQPFTIFDSTYQALPYNTPRAVFNGDVPNNGNGLVATGANTYNYLTFSQSQIAHVPMSLAPGSSWPAYMSGRDAFRAPGWWNLDLGVYKDLPITERVRIQLRGEAFNVFNHANLYVVGNSADLGGGNNAVTACYGCTGSTYDRRHMQLAAKIIF